MKNNSRSVRLKRELPVNQLTNAGGHTPAEVIIINIKFTRGPAFFRISPAPRRRRGTIRNFGRVNGGACARITRFQCSFGAFRCGFGCSFRPRENAGRENPFSSLIPPVRVNRRVRVTQRFFFRFSRWSPDIILQNNISD